ncbi:thymidine phosphorylase family protein [Dongia sp.]|uniref:thymidine phosphorylase family protein n=1 Tax=Dongia sp. TaxID=1977262 RepID=UPI00375012A5
MTRSLAATPTTTATDHSLQARRLGVHTQDQAIVFMRTDCHVCRSEGLSARSQVSVRSDDQEIVATLYQISTDVVQLNEVGLSEAAWHRLQVTDGDRLTVRHADPVESLAEMRRRIYGHRLDDGSLRSIVSDIVAGRYSDVHLSAFVTACAALPLDHNETIALTRVMFEVGERLSWPGSLIVDKHSVGGLPGNRTTPIVVAIVAAHGLTMPKTSSRAITSPAGTADAMETLAPVDLDLAAIRRVVERESGCIVWGGSVRLSPADDVLIRVERALDLDSEGQLIASVLSKKIAAGSTHVVLDLPVGPTAKIRSADTAATLSQRLVDVAGAFGLQVRVVQSDGSQPVGQGIGPALEARDVLAVLQDCPGAPADLRDRACTLAGALLELGGDVLSGTGRSLAGQILADGRAWRKFQNICEAQGGMRIPAEAAHQHPLLVARSGRIVRIDNRKLAKLAKLAGAPDSKAAGVHMECKLGHQVQAGQPFCVVHAETRGELEYALDYAAAHLDIFEVSADE